MTRRAIAVLAMAWSAAAAGMNFPPVASASASPAQVWVGEAVQLSSAGSLDPDSSPAGLTFSWDFGDGSAPSTLPDPLHTYSRAGAFTVTLTVFDGAATSLAGATVTVLARPTPTPPCSPSRARSYASTRRRRAATSRRRSPRSSASTSASA